MYHRFSRFSQSILSRVMELYGQTVYASGCMTYHLQARSSWTHSVLMPMKAVNEAVLKVVEETSCAEI